MAENRTGKGSRAGPLNRDDKAPALEYWMTRGMGQSGQGSATNRNGPQVQASDGKPTRTNRPQGYNPNEPRDEHGRWTAGGGAMAQRRNWMDRSPGMRKAVGNAALMVGRVPGIARGALHTVEGAAQGLGFAARLINPYDHVDDPSNSAWMQVLRAGKGAFDYTEKGISNPKVVADDIGAGLHRFQIEIDPNASPAADTLWGEATRNFNIGENQGEAAFDVGSFLFGGAAAKELAAMGGISKEALMAKYAARGYSKPISEYFSEPYTGEGHHFLPKRVDLPKWLGGGPIPRWIKDSPFFLLRPPNMSRGDFYKLHHGVDPHYHGGKVQKKFGGGGWSGKKLGWTKYDQLGRLWHGSPAPLKAAVGGSASIGAATHQISTGEGSR